MNTCPHCGSTRCLDLLRKLTMGPSSSARCRECGYRVGLDVEAVVWAIFLEWAPLLLLVFAAGPGGITYLWIGILFGLFCFFTGLGIHLFGVRLMPDELTTPAMVAEGRSRISLKKKKR